ncbi:MAG TPA: hypothetical protein VII97_09845 [Anaerolineales bacterium]
METVEFQPQPAESILYRNTPNRKWYVIAWKIGSGIMGITILTFIIFALFAGPTEGAFISFLPAWAASLLTKSLYLGLFLLATAAWVAEDVACTFIGEFILTNQRIWVRGSPYAWSQSATPLEDIASLTWRGDAIFIRQKSTQKIQVHMFSDGK